MDARSSVATRAPEFLKFLEDEAVLGNPEEWREFHDMLTAPYPDIEACGEELQRELYRQVRMLERNLHHDLFYQLIGYAPIGHAWALWVEFRSSNPS